MRHFRQLLRREGDMITGVIECLSGLSLLLFALWSMLAVQHPVGAEAGLHHGFSSIVRPIAWQGTLLILGLSQVVCSLRQTSPLCSVFTSYPASVACLFAGLSACLYGNAFEPLAWFAFGWGVLNLAVIKHSVRKARDIRCGY